MTSFDHNELHELTPAPRPSLLRANLWYLLAAAGLMLLSLAAALFVRHAPFEVNAELLNSLVSTAYEIGILALPVILYAASNYGAGKAVRFNRPDVRMLLFAALLAAIGVFMANYLTMWWLLLIEKMGGTPQASGISIPADTASLLLSILLVGIVPGVCEETLFRGGLMSAWERFGKKTALIMTSILFALLHGTIAGLPNQIMMGLILGYIVLMSDSIYTGMVYHAVHNSLTMLMAYAANRSADMTAASAEMTESISASMGGAEGYAALLIITAVMVTIFILVLIAMTEYAKKSGKDTALIDARENTPLSPAPRFVCFLPLLAALCVIAFNYTADFIATFGG